jgi:hypothetical protein
MQNSIELALTTFSQDDPAAARTLPRLLMHWALEELRVGRRFEGREIYGVLLYAARDDLTGLVRRCLTTEEDEAGHFCCVREDVREGGQLVRIDFFDGHGGG